MSKSLSHHQTMISLVDFREWMRTWSRRKSDSECGRPLPPPCRVNYHLDDRLLDGALDDGRVDDNDNSLGDRIDDRLVDRFDDDSIDDPLL